MIQMFKNFTSRKIIVIMSFGIVASILWNTYNFSKEFKRNERSKMEILAKAYHQFGASGLNKDYSLEAKIIESNHNIPMILTNEHGVIEMNRNLDSIKALDSLYLEDQLRLMKKENPPITLNYSKGKKHVIYYRDSDLLTRLKYYPLTLILILILFSGIIYLVIKSNKIAEQNKLWTGMAKETAHQIGTPLSSLLGWVELMKLGNTSVDMVTEIEKDITRLNIIAERFSKIGSVPKMANLEIGETIKNTVEYFKSRSSKSIHFNYIQPEIEVLGKVNEQLFTWVLENLIKNAIDAMAGKGALAIDLKKENKTIKITVTDSGKGIPRNLFKKIFSPGFTTKKRGWGLGLSLSKRIIEEYHSGKIFVKKSELSKGTVFEIQLDVLKV